jgi:hypothetical protein
VDDAPAVGASSRCGSLHSVVIVVMVVIFRVVAVEMMVLVLVGMAVVTVMVLVLVGMAVVAMVVLVLGFVRLVRRIVGPGRADGKAQGGDQRHRQMDRSLHDG